MSMSGLPEAVQRELEVFRERTKKSREIFGKTAPLIPYGVNSNYRAWEPYPVYFSSGRGSKIFDADGNEYIDYNLAFGVLVAGHNHPAVVEAVKERIVNGTILGFEYERVYELAEIVSRRFNVEMVRFQSTGLEATLHAIRIARGYTGRDKIIKFLGHYHGSHDYVLVGTKPNIYAAGHVKYPARPKSGPGIPDLAVEDTLVAQFNDLESVEILLSEHPDEVAAVILEPVAMNIGLVPADKEFMWGLRRLCDEYGVILIFDEVKTSGKLYGGAEEYYGVRPDMKTMAKAVAGGYPLSIIGGRKEIMEEVGPGKIPHAGTFNSNPLAVDAAIATLTEALTREAMERSARLNEELAKAYDDVLSDAGVPHNIKVFGNSATVFFTDNEVKNWHDFLRYNHVGMWWAYFIAMMNRGVVATAPGYDEQWTISVQHTEEDIEKTIEALKEVAPILSEEIPRIKIIEAF